MAKINENFVTNGCPSDMKDSDMRSISSSPGAMDFMAEGGADDENDFEIA